MRHKKPTCPYCQADKDHPDGVAMGWKYKAYYTDRLNHVVTSWWQCPKCGSRSPAIKADDYGNMFVRSYEAATGRFRPMQKPMTRDRARNVNNGTAMYLEEKVAERMDAIWMRTNRYPGSALYYDNGEVRFLLESEIDWDNYGKKWRCWATRPTDAECAAAPWEED